MNLPYLSGGFTNLAATHVVIPSCGVLVSRFFATAGSTRMIQGDQIAMGPAVTSVVLAGSLAFVSVTFEAIQACR